MTLEQDKATGTCVDSHLPQQLRIGRQPLTHLGRVLDAAFPEEGCALLLGRRQHAVWTLERIWPCLNVWMPPQERQRRFAIDPREQLLAQKWARSAGVEVLGSAHSHPCGEAVPSRTDRDLCFTPALMLIRGGGGELGCWWMEENDEPRPLEWKMVD
jgi:proteasome lid subunit RPN8/RPN11